MRVKQAYVSSNVIEFKEAFFNKWGLHEYSDPDAPAVFFGLYATLIEDIMAFTSHRGEAIIFWAGSDAMKIDWRVYNLIKSRSAKHVAQSSFISDDLRRIGIKHDFVPVTTANIDAEVCPRGDSVYFYGNRDFYGLNLVPEIRSITGLDIIMAKHNTYTKQELIDVYKACFMGLRLTPHDGLPHTVVELGLMGRRCLHNGSVPTVIPYSDTNDICSKIMTEYKSRHEDNSDIARQMYDYINISDSWLNL